MESPTTDDFEHVVIGGIRTIRITSSDLARVMLRDCLASRETKQLPKLVFSSNGHGISLAGKDPEFRGVMRHANIIHADGMSVVFASRLLTRKRLPERVATTDFFHDAAKAGEAHGLRFFLLGGREEVNATAYERAKRLYPGIRWVGRRHGFFEEREEAEVCAKILAAKPDVLWVALGRPKQESFALRNRERLAGVGWIKTGGGLFEFLAGVNRRAPGWMQHAGLEWLWRVMQEPKRLAWRYASTNLHAAWRLAVHSRNK